MKKALSGQGSMRHRPDGRWEARYWDAAGIRRSVYAKTAREVQRKLDAKRRGRDLGVREATTEISRLQFGQFLDQWLEALKDEPDRIRPTTWQQYRKVIESWIKPELGHVRLLKLSHRELNQLYGTLLKRGLSTHTVKSVHSVIRAALRWAREEEMIGIDPAALARPPKKPVSQLRALTTEEVRRVLNSAEQSPYGTLYAMALWGGFRMGELAGLRWEDIDFETGIVSVRKAISQITHVTAKALGLSERVFLGQPKTPGSVRLVALPTEVMEGLGRHRTQQQKRYLAAKDKQWSEGVHVFQSLRRLGDPVHQGTINEQWHQLQQAAGIPADRQVRFHDTRRTSATWGAGSHDIRNMMERLGHRGEEMTLHYTDASNQRAILRHMEQELAEARNKALREAK